MKSGYIIAILVLIILAGGAYMVINTPAGVPVVTDNGNNSQGGQQATTTPAQTAQIKIALLDTTGSGTGKSRGCDNIVLATRTIPATSSPLTAAMQALFAEPEGTQPSTQYNFIARTKNTLKFERATVASSTAYIYLTGSLSGLAGVCDDPRAQAQIEETALQFPTVTKVELYLNGTPATLIPASN